MRKYQKSFARFTVFVFVLATLAGYPAFVQAAVRTLANWGSINVSEFNVSEDIYLQTVFATDGSIFLGAALDPATHFTYFVTSTDMVDWDIQARFFSLVYGNDRFFGVAAGGLFTTDLSLQWQQASLPVGVVPSHLNFRDGVFRLFYRYDGREYVMMSQDGDVWYDYRGYIPEGSSSRRIFTADGDLFTMTFADGTLRALTSVGFSEDTEWEEIAALTKAVEYENTVFRLQEILFSGTTVAVSLYASPAAGVNWGDWEAPSGNGIVLVSYDMENWHQTYWGGLAPDWVTRVEVPGFNWNVGRHISSNFYATVHRLPVVNDGLESVGLECPDDDIWSCAGWETFVTLPGIPGTTGRQLTRIFLAGEQVSRAYAVSEETPAAVDPLPPPTADPPPARVWPETVTANPSAHNIFVNGAPVAFVAYNIEGNNFFRLRDIAYTLNGTAGQFAVGWDAATGTASLTTGSPYAPVGGEMEGAATEAVTATLSRTAFVIDGQSVTLTAYNIGGNNFLMLAELSRHLGFSATWDPVNSAVLIETE